MPHDPAATEPPPIAEVADRLGVDPSVLEGADLTLEVYGEGARPEIGVAVVPAEGPSVFVPLPDRFITGKRPRIDLAGLAEWLGLTSEETDPLPDSVGLDLCTDHGPGGHWEIDEDAADDLWLDSTLALPLRGETQGPIGPTIMLPIPDEQPEHGETTVSGEESLGPVSRPTLGDTDAWPDDVDGWLVFIDRLAKERVGTLRAGDVRSLLAGFDDEVLELTDQGPVDDEGRPVADEGAPDVGTLPDRLRGPVEDEESSWDPSTDPLDPALEEAMRIRELPGALPPPDDPPHATQAGPPAPDEVEADLPLIPMDNRVMIVAEPDPPSPWWSRLVVRWTLAGLGVGLLLLVVLLLVFGGGDDTTTDSSDEDLVASAGGGENLEETAEDVLRRATQDLLDARTAEIEQTFTVTDGSGGSNEVSAVGTVDFESGASRSTVAIDGAPFDAYLADGMFAFDAGTGWVTARPGELQANEQAEQTGLTAFGIAETMDPVGVTALLEAAESIEEIGAGRYAATVTLPVDGADTMIESVYGRPQAELEGLTVPVEITIDEDGSITVAVVFEFDEAIDFFADDPLAASLAGISLSNTTRFFEPGTEAPIAGPDTDARDLDTVLDQLG